MITMSTIISCTGSVRENNEDNYLYNGHIRSSEKTTYRTLFTNEPKQCFAVLDGMGGHSDGEIASSLSAKNLNEIINDLNLNELNSDFRKYLTNVIHLLNDKVCEIVKQSRKRLGTTASILITTDDAVFLSHLGDSSCFLYRDKKLTKISTDHTDNYHADGNTRKGKLTQYLGILPNEFILEPKIEKLDVYSNDIYILCSDGLTDLVKAEEIEKKLSESVNIVQFRKQMESIYFDRGAVDNMTLCVIQIL